MTNTEKLNELLCDILLLEPSEVHPDLTRDDVETWDSLAVVSIAVGAHETFGHHFTPDEASSINSVSDIMKLLGKYGVSFDD